MNDDTTLVIALNVKKVNLILSALGQLPYIQVASVIDEIKTQSEDQLKIEVTPK